MKVVVAPDRFPGAMPAGDVVAAIAAGWREARPDDELVVLPLSDGGAGMLDVVAGPDDTWTVAEVAGPLGHPVRASLLLRSDATAVVEAARACGPQLVAEPVRDPLAATTYGVGQLLDAAREAGAQRVLVGLDGAIAIDGGAGALLGLGFRLTVDGGGGLKIGGRDLDRVTQAGRGWSADWSGIEVVLLAAGAEPLSAAPWTVAAGPSGDAAATPADVLRRWADVAERDLASGAVHRCEPGTGDGGGLGFGLRCGLPDARLASGPEVVAELRGLRACLADADLVVTAGEGSGSVLSRPSVLGTVVAGARTASVPAVAIVHATLDGADPADAGPDPSFLPEAAVEVVDRGSADLVSTVAGAARRAAMRITGPR